MGELLTPKEMSKQNGMLIITDLKNFPKMQTEDLKTERKRWKWRHTHVFLPIVVVAVIKLFVLLAIAITTSVRHNHDAFEFLMNPFLIGSFLYLGVLYELLLWDKSIHNKIISIESVLWARWVTSLPPDKVPAVYTYDEITDPRLSS